MQFCRKLQSFCKMDNIILHATTLKDFQAIIGEVVEEKLRQFKQNEPIQPSVEYITRQEVCKLLRISLATLHSYTKDGTLNGYRIGGRVLYRKDEIERSLIEIQSTKYKHGRI